MFFVVFVAITQSHNLQVSFKGNRRLLPFLVGTLVSLVSV